MGTELRSVPNIDREILQKKGRYLRHSDSADIMITTVNPSYRRVDNLAEANLCLMHQQLTLSKDEARALAIELMLFAEGQEIEDRYIHG